MISADDCNAITADLHGLAERHVAITEWEAVAFMLAFAMRQMGDLDDDARDALTVYAAGLAAAMHEARGRLN